MIALTFLRSEPITPILVPMREYISIYRLELDAKKSLKNSGLLMRGEKRSEGSRGNWTDCIKGDWRLLIFAEHRLKRNLQRKKQPKKL